MVQENAAVVAAGLRFAGFKNAAAVVASVPHFSQTAKSLSKDPVGTLEGVGLNLITFGQAAPAITTYHMIKGDIAPEQGVHLLVQQESTALVGLFLGGKGAKGAIKGGVKGRAPLAGSVDEVGGTFMERLEPLEQTHAMIDETTEVIPAPKRVPKPVDEIQQAADQWTVQHMRKLLFIDDIMDWAPKAKFMYKLLPGRYGQHEGKGNISIAINESFADQLYAQAHELVHFKSEELGGGEGAFNTRYRTALGKFQEELGAHIVGARLSPNSLLGKVLTRELNVRGTPGFRGIARFISEEYGIDPAVIRAKYPGYVW